MNGHKIIGLFLHNDTLPINCILMGLITYFMFETQINYMWSVKKFKVSEILHVTTFYIIYSPNFS
jgi:hypothetical protein